MSGLAVTRVVTGPWRANCYIVSEGSGRALLIDPGDDSERIVRSIDEHRLLPVAIFATHGHHDHVGAAAPLKHRYGVPFYLHRGDEGLFARFNFYRALFDKASPVELATVDGWLDTEGALPVGGLDLRVLHTPGHTAGSVSLLLQDLLFTGDVLMKGRVGRTDLPGGSRQALARSLNALASMAPETQIFPGHGEATRLGDELATSTELRLLIDAPAH